MGNVVAFPGVILTKRETGSEQPPRPPVTSTPCPLCAARVWSSDMDAIGCGQCRRWYHAPCFWRVLPIAEWIAFLTWIDETSADQEMDFICAACRQLEGRGKERG